jgi:endo-1,4-beta-xylanase
MISRRALLKSAGMYAAIAHPWLGAQTLPSIPGAIPLKDIGQKSGRRIGVFTVAGVMAYNPELVALTAREFSMVADMNDLKFSDRLRPTPDTYEFKYGDIVVQWAQQHGIPIRGHCLVWWNVLPKWFNSYVSASNGKQVMTDHITTTLKHYAGKMYSWDVVNEPIYHDHRPDGLRFHPWVEFVGPDYIDIAFHTAAAADPKARLLLNECYIEHNTPSEIERRGQLLTLLARLKKSGVPIHGLGIQGHLRGNTPIDKPGMLTFVKQVKDLGLDILITEMDVDDIDVPVPMIDQVVARKYGEFIDLVGPYASSISFEWGFDDPHLRRPDGLIRRPDMFDENFQPTPAYAAVSEALGRLPQYSSSATTSELNSPLDIPQALQVDESSTSLFASKDAR